MASHALGVWRTTSQAELDQLTAAHANVEGDGRPGRRFATQQVTYGYVILLSSHFQRFCRDLHSESIDFFVGQLAVATGHPPKDAQVAVRIAMTRKRDLDHGNPADGKIASDFNVLGIQLWKDLFKRDARNVKRVEKLKQLLKWRNAIAHHDFANNTNGQTRLWLKSVNNWRGALNGLAGQIDLAVGQHLARVVGRAPW